MKTKLIATLALLISFSSQAEFSTYSKTLNKGAKEKASRTTNNSSSTDLENKQIASTERNTIFQLGSVSGDLSIGGSNNTSDSTLKIGGLDLKIGRIIDLQNGFETTTSLGLRSLTIDDGETNSSITNVSYVDASLSQRLSLVSEIGDGLKIKPFVAAGLGYGMHEFNVQTTQNGVNLRGNFTQNYLSINYGAGLEAEFSNGLTPFVSYQISQLKFASEASFEGTANGQSVTETSDFDAEDEETKTLMIGLGYRF